jgi:uncharacterized protein YvpB
MQGCVKVKKLGLRIIVFLLLILMLGAFKYIEKKEIITSPTISNANETYPYISIIKDGISYNVMYPYTRDVEMITGDSYTSFYADEIVELELTDTNNVIDITYEIVDMINDEVIIKSLINKNNITIENNRVLAKILIPNIKKKVYPYLLKLTYNKNNNTTLSYYQNFYITDKVNISEINKKVIQFHNSTFNKDINLINQLIKIDGTKSGSLAYANNNSDIKSLIWDFGLDIIKMNDPYIRIKNIDNNNQKYDVELKYTVAVRINHEFEYWDFIEKYKLSGNENISIDSFERLGSTKTDAYYDEINNNIVIGAGSSNIITQHKQSDNEQFYCFVRNNQLWLFDMKTNRLNKIFGFDKLDSDYLVDNYNQHKVEIVDIDNNGKIIYIVYGYMNTGENEGNNGIAIYKFNYYSRLNERIGFISLPYNFQKLDYYMKYYKYIPKGEQYLYSIIDSNLYQFDLAVGDIKKLQEHIPYDVSRFFVTDNGKTMMWNENINEKENKTVKGITIKGHNLLKYELNNGKDNIHVLESYENNLIIGYYNISDTIEKLDGSVTYLYSKLQIINENGSIIEEINSENGTFYKDIRKTQNGIIMHIAKKDRYIHSNPIYSRVDINHIREEEIVLRTNKEVTVGFSNMETPFNYTKMLITSEDMIAKSLIDNTYTIKEKEHNINIHYFKDEEVNRIIYELVSNGKYEGMYETITDALINKEQDTNVYILRNLNKGKKIMYTSKKYPYRKIRGIPVIPQKPDLPRGCEVTSLAMLLNYDLTEKVDKLQLANEVTKDTTPYEIIDGMIKFGDVHKGFVGDMANSKKKGYAVYHEPIIELAEKYIPNKVINISGSSFEDVLYYVGIGRPVWVISPNIYTKVPKSSIQQWNTSSGIIEISFHEHSVLIVGYDSQYVYFNDPSKNMVRKKKITDFKAGWDNLGKQAILIY